MGLHTSIPILHTSYLIHARWICHESVLPTILSSVPYRDLEPVSKQLTIVVGLTVVGFMAFGLALSFYRNILFEETLRNISGQNDELQKEIDSSQADLDYYQSAQYKDKYAKETLNRITPGEKLLIITEEPTTPNLAVAAFTPSEAKEAAYQEHLREIPVFQHWYLYLFERDKIDTLRKGI